ncbi:TetR/AcrR family transcriptional regulator [Clavibacter michiganensis]|uniref:TetR/AcrR family transcriptional regulator n=1 Tax=Clavibacter michiganensis TaxID=28447 RepID=UPI00292E1216|nr:TetR/AcrR family transcriptional regulator [Clavibacter michiganensis]
MELLDVFLGDWLTALSAELDAGVDARRGSEVRARQLADVLAGSLAGRGVLCDLFGAQGGVLEHDVSVEVVTRDKRASLARLTTATDLVRRHVPELGDGAQSFCLMSLVTARALASYVPPPASLIAAYAEDPALGVLHFDFRHALRDAFTASLLGALPRA